MRPLREILLPTDFSPPCVDLAPYAAGVARPFSSKITLLHVLAPLNPAFAAFGSGAMVEEVLAHQMEETCNSLNSFLADEFRGIPVKRIVSEGDPAETITGYCASERVGLVMMPTRGCAAYRRLILGSVTTKVLQDVNCPVWTSSHVADRHTVSPIPKVIVCAIGWGPGGAPILKWTADLAAGLQARLVVVHALSSSEFHLETHSPGTEIRRVLDDAYARISNVLHGSPLPGAEVRVEGGSSVPEVIHSVVEDSRADLLIIGRTSNGGMMGQLRTHSYTLIRESGCPVISI